MKDFSNADVTVTMKGGEWFALTAKAAGKPLSKIGQQLAASAGRKLCDQLSAASDALPDMPASRYRFTLVCPGCNKTTEQMQAHRVPQPALSCGDCLMDKVEVVDLKVLKVEEVKAA